MSSCIVYGIVPGSTGAVAVVAPQAGAEPRLLGARVVKGNTPTRWASSMVRALEGLESCRLRKGYHNVLPRLWLQTNRPSPSRLYTKDTEIYDAAVYEGIALASTVTVFGQAPEVISGEAIVASWHLLEKPASMQQPALACELVTGYRVLYGDKPMVCSGLVANAALLATAVARRLTSLGETDQQAPLWA